ncbi:aspartate-semialdehyde dehydrogenase, partial [bacterium]|nr:aspartate-semialdehyde dehydrogenase [bacterium]
MNIGIVGATGMVGSVFLDLLKERNFPVTTLRPFGSENSLGKEITYNQKAWPLEVLKEGCFKGLDLVFFSSGDEISLEWGPKAASEGALVVDNSAAFRMDPNTPLVVPEINIDQIPKTDRPGVIANPNCSTIQLVVALNPLLKEFGLQRVHVASYQSVSGGGKEAQQELLNQLEKTLKEEPAVENKCFPHNISK